jgi:hypothetical protein
MTIAACYVSHEGVILGSDSSTTYPSGANAFRHFNHAQKIFEVGETGSTLGLLTWGRGGLPNKSYRQLTADLSDSLISNKPTSVKEAASRWVGLFWPEYCSQLKAVTDAFNVLDAIPTRAPDQQSLWEAHWQALFVGFCLGGHVCSDRTPAAYEILFMPGASAPPAPISITQNLPRFWGMPNMMDRLLKGIDAMIYNGVRTSPHWNGTVADLDAVIIPHVLDANVQLPLREAIDWIFSSIFITIKAMKFYKDPPFCGGPIEVAVITADRRFRWVRHKGLDQALNDHTAYGGI